MFHPLRAIALSVLWALPFVVTAQAETILTVDARSQAMAPATGFLKMGTAIAPDGQVLGINSQYLVRNGKPWLPVMGEFHYSRYPEQYWEEELLKMKAAGVQIVATYVIWSHHEEVPGAFNFSGDRDLHHFLELCARHGLLAWVRLGPWAHGEARFGGTPDWVVAMVPTRSNDAAYLEYVHRYWTEIAKQLQGLLLKDGGPVIGVQLENEYNLAGAGRGAEHIAELKRMALELGIDSPYYSVTGWDGALYPPGEVVPTFAGYPDEPWDTSTGQLSPREVYQFRFDSRVAGNAGTQTAATAAGTWIEDRNRTPFLGAEFGGGVPTMYRRRPLIDPNDVGAMMPVELGSGVNLYGFYMFHGGRNPVGRTTLEESTLTGAYNDVPIIGYDFQAPLGQYGQQQPVMSRIRRVHYFLEAFGADLAPMTVHAPDVLPRGRDDLSTPRFSVRAKNESGFVFLNNHVRQFPMKTQSQVQFRVELPKGDLTFPNTPVDIPADAYFIWPFNLNVGPVRMLYATAQPITRLQNGSESTLFMFAHNGIPVELALANEAIARLSLQGGGMRARRIGGRTVITGIRPGTAAAIRVETKDGKSARIVILTEAQSQNAWVMDLWGSRRLVIADSQLFADEHDLILRNVGKNIFQMSIYPALAQRQLAFIPGGSAGRDGLFQSITAAVPQRRLSTVAAVNLRPAREVPPIALGGLAGAALQPAPEVFGRSAAWTLQVEPHTLEGLSDAILELDYRGDVGRLFSGPRMLDDNYFDGQTWRVGLKRFAAQLREPLILTVLPLRDDAPVYIDARYRPKSSAGGQVAALDSVRVVPEYELRVRIAP